jgi:hypothetical protein
MLTGGGGAAESEGRRVVIIAHAPWLPRRKLAPRLLAIVLPTCCLAVRLFPAPGTPTQSREFWSSPNLKFTIAEPCWFLRQVMR